MPHVLQNTPDALEGRPEAKAFKVEDLVYEMGRGRVRIPAFQRGFRWGREDARKLIDSIYRGYPVGILLFWETGADVDEIRLGSIKISGEARSDALWVVDGQQRIVSLARVLMAEAGMPDEFALYFDLDASALVFPPTEKALKADIGRWLPLTEVLDAERLMQWVLQHAPSLKERRDRAIQLGRWIREYEVPAYLVRTDNEAILREVFGRINTAGQKLQVGEVFDALHGARRQSSPATIQEVTRDLESLDFGHLEESKILYRLLLAIQGQDDVRRSGRELRLSPEQGSRAYQDTERAVRKAIQFIRDEVDIPHYELLPYKQPLVALGKFFHDYPAPSARSRELLSRWVWRGALSGVHRGDAASTQKTLRLIGPRYAEAASVQQLLDQFKGQAQGFPAVDEAFKFSSASSRLQTLALLALNPLHLQDGSPIQPQWLAPAGGGHGQSRIPQIIPPSDHQSFGPSVANRLFHPPVPGLRERLERIRDQRVAASHGIPPEALDALRSGDSGRFLELRAEYLSQHFQGFFAAKARWGETDRSALTSLIVGDDEEIDERENGAGNHG